MSKQSNSIIYERYRKQVSDAKDPCMKGSYFDGKIWLATDHLGFCKRSDELPSDVFIAPHGMDNNMVYKLMEPHAKEIERSRLPLPTVSDLKAFIRNNNLHRQSTMTKPWIRACRYKLNDYNYVNVFYLLDMITLIPDGVLYGQTKWSYFHFKDKDYRKYMPVMIKNDRGEYAIVMPIKPPDSD